MGVIASAPAKVILFGEHFVVYGEPAIVLAIDKRAYVKAEKRDDEKIYIHSKNLNFAGYYENNKFRIECGDAEKAKSKFEPIHFAIKKILEKYGKNAGLNIEITSTVPVGAGLGSSAAVAAATTAAVSTLLDVKISKEEIFRITYEAEKIVHGTPSGIDPAISTFGEALLFQMDTGFKPLSVDMDIPLVIGNTGIERSTKTQINKVRNLKEKYPQIMGSILRTAREIVLTALEVIKQRDLETLGELMNINHALLYGVGVSDESLEWLINAARKAGALGAKLTGAGGGGCMIALTSNENIEKVFEAIQRVGGIPFTAKKTNEGVRIEQA